MSDNRQGNRSAIGQGAPRAWQRMLSGRRLDLLDPSPADVAIEDIAHGLARVARWNGQTTGEHALSVAQHSLVVEGVAADRNPGWPAQWRLAALLHDAPEYVIGDLISPFKAAVGLDYKAFELKLLDAIHRAFAVPSPLPTEITDAIKEADRIAAYFEATRLAGFAEGEALNFFGSPGGISGPLAASLAGLTPLPVHEAQAQFLARFHELCG